MPKRSSAWLIMLATMFSPVTGLSCEPIVPRFHLLSGSLLAGPALLTQSLMWLLVAVAVKGAPFICLEIRLPWSQAAYFMPLANAFSTIPGVLLGGFTGSGAGVGIILALPVVFALGWIVQRRIARLPESPRCPRISGGTAMLAFVGFCIVSILLYATAQSVLDGRDYTTYWILKFLFVAFVACSGIVISAVLEECVIAGLARKSAGNQSFYTSVFRANCLTLGLVLLVVTMEMLPERLRSPHFITSWPDSILTTLLM